VDDLCVYFGVDKEREPAVVPLVGSLLKPLLNVKEPVEL
jgi:hypothetical protein